MLTFNVTALSVMEIENEDRPMDRHESLLGSFGIRARSTREAAEWVRKNLTDHADGVVAPSGREVSELVSWFRQYTTSNVWRIAPAIR